MDQIREIVLSWRIMDVADIIGGDESVILSLLNLLEDEDPTIRLRALSALDKLIRERDKGIKTLVIRNGFGKLVSCLEDDDPRVVVRSIEVLGRLFEGSPIDEAKLRLLIDGMVSIAKHHDTFIQVSLLDALDKLQLPPLSWESRRDIEELLLSEDLYLKSSGLRLFLNSGSLDGKGSLVLEGIRELLRSKNTLIIEAGLGFLEDVMKFHLSSSTMKDLVSFLSVLKNIENTAESAILRVRTSKVRRQLERVLASYYSSRREEVREVIKTLVSSGDRENALNLALLVGELQFLQG